MRIHRKSIYLVWEKIGKEIDDSGVERFVRKAFCKDGVYGYFIDDDLVGAVGFDEKDDENLEIIFNWVLPEFQGKGIGRELMKFSEGVAKERDYKKLCLEVLKENKKAVNFYEELGYKIIDEEDKEDNSKLIMGKKIK